MAKRGTRRVSKKGLFTRVYSPLYHLLEATRNVGKSVFKRSGRVVDEALGLGQDVGTSVTRHANMTVRDVISRKRKSRRSTRRSSRRGTSSRR